MSISLENPKEESLPKKGKRKKDVSPIQLKTEFEQELEKGLIKKQTFKGITTYFNSKGERVNANGEPCTKTGQPDKRKLNKAIGSYWQKVAEKNKTNKEIKTATVESDSDSEAEFEIEYEIPPTVPPTVPQPAQPPQVELSKYEQLIKDQEEIRKKYDDQLKKAKEENEKLKSGLVFNDHLSRISHLARNTKLKF